MPSRFSLLLQGCAVTAVTASASFFIWTKHARFEPMDPSTDPTFKTLFYNKFNPNRNPTFHDVCVRRIAINKIDRALVKDANEGGDKLVTRFAQGVWGGFGFGIQREYLAYKYKNDTTTKHQLWTKKELLNDDYKEGAEITDHFKVLSRPDNHTILFRCGASPLDHPDSARPGDGLFEMSAEAKFDQGYAEFRLKSVFYQGEGKAEKAPFDGDPFMQWAHREYAKLWMENAVGNCKQKLTGDIDWDVVKGKKSAE